MTEFIKNGVKLITTYITVYVNEFDLSYLGDWAEKSKKLFGISLIATDVLYPNRTNHIFFDGQEYLVKDYCAILELETVPRLATNQEDFYKTQAAVVSNSFIGLCGNYVICRGKIKSAVS